ncbi:hypothetical protein XU18_2470 [Perkinsela sp. CCAP 1560/4]|nr:hypothetical protein XU18_4117 [Perkinsela sp. CCAP 1560/4]KNH06710.1 hypothetical protein XU18_2470 [Perkinsela sp. CCAP 1560/4]|eukprot:KNH04705.1 hypothetical protein XU18_4117 [Perkinsela sp. CCAP 1560/4]
MTRITVCYFAESLERLEHFRQQEIESIAEIWRIEKGYGPKELCTFLESPADSTIALMKFHSAALLKFVASRAVLLHSVCEQIVIARSMNLMLRKLSKMQSVLENLGMGVGRRFKLHIHASGFSFTAEEKRRLYEVLGLALPHVGIVDLVTPETEFWVFFEGKRSEHDGPQLSIQRICFTKLLYNSARQSLLARYSLKTRPHIGTTSLPPELSFLLANIGLIRSSALVYDCFCGTGSTLVSAGHFGAICLGSDRDARTMRGRPSPKRKQTEKKYPKPRSIDLAFQGPKSIVGNMDYYDLQKRSVDFMRLSVESCKDLWRTSRGGLFDAIVTDPPYGIREGAKRVDRVKCSEMSLHRMNINTAGDQCPLSSIPFVQYSTAELESDLLNFAASSLRLHGRIVFWHPTAIGVADYFPTHPCLQLLYKSTHNINVRFSRDLLVFEKICEPSHAEKATDQTDKWVAFMMNFKRRELPSTDPMQKDSVRDVYFATPTWRSG